MKRNIFLGTAVVTAFFAMASCGGADETTDENNEGTDTVNVEEEVEVTTYNVDTESSVINWYVTEEGEKAHWGTTKISEGSFTAEGDVITEASLTMDMNSVTADDKMGAKLMEHLKTADFLNIENYGTSTFSFDRHEEGMIYGTLNVAGLKMDVKAPATVTEATVTISDFEVDMVQFPFYQTERAEKAEEEWHNPMVGFNATIVGK